MTPDPTCVNRKIYNSLSLADGITEGAFDVERSILFQIEIE